MSYILFIFSFFSHYQIDLLFVVLFLIQLDYRYLIKIMLIQHLVYHYQRIMDQTKLYHSFKFFSIKDGNSFYHY
jgi:hypothetical protein